MKGIEIVLGFDYGTRRIGVAVGDTITTRARPVATLDCNGAIPFDRIAHVIAELLPTRLLVGIPYNVDGSPTRLTGSALEFATGLERRFGLPVSTVDERHSSQEAEAILRDARRSGIRRRRVRHADVDREAARIIVERWLAGERARPTQT
jgi:putative Holliday junction resolvase